jgi:UDP-3-O-[3-hydroxymyristoyl] glucosamine N-acyltransferase
MNNNLLILGAGQFSAVVEEIAVSSGAFDKIDFLDDSADSRHIGKLDDYLHFKNDYHFAIVSIGDPKTRKKWTEKLIECGYTVPTIISPKAYVSKMAEIGNGCVISPMSVINPNTRIGDGTFITAGSVIDHNAVVCSFCNIQCGTVVMPSAIVADFTKTQPNEVVRRSYMVYTKDNDTFIGKAMTITTDGNTEG